MTVGTSHGSALLPSPLAIYQKELGREIEYWNQSEEETRTIGKQT